MLIEGHPRGFKYFMDIDSHSHLNPVHHFKEFLVLDLHLKAHLFGDPVHAGLNIIKIGGAVAEIHQHNHDKMTGHDFLGDILYIDVVIEQQVRNTGDNALLIFADNRYERQLLIGLLGQFAQIGDSLFFQS